MSDVRVAILFTNTQNPNLHLELWMSESEHTIWYKGWTFKNMTSAIADTLFSSNSCFVDTEALTVRSTLSGTWIKATIKKREAAKKNKQIL